ncbi:hypothetical protein F4805DRAFT_473082 [Annulohypoxylon moriforme]|nr:hypothetical protein F4805DRAFT_473082 [Annulohypoxylon moriforme]
MEFIKNLKMAIPPPFFPIALILLYLTLLNVKDYFELGPVYEVVPPVVTGLAYLCAVSPVLGYGALSFASLAVAIVSQLTREFRVPIMGVIAYLTAQTAAVKYSSLGWCVFGLAVCLIRWHLHGPWTLFWAAGDLTWTYLTTLMANQVMYTNSPESGFGRFSEFWSYMLGETRKLESRLRCPDGIQSYLKDRCSRLPATVVRYLAEVRSSPVAPPLPAPPAPVLIEEPAVVAPVEDPAEDLALREKEREVRELEARNIARVHQLAREKSRVTILKPKPNVLIKPKPPLRPGTWARCSDSYSWHSRLVWIPSPFFKRPERVPWVPMLDYESEFVRGLVREQAAAQQQASQSMLGPQPVPTYEPAAGPQYVPELEASLVPGYAPVAQQQVAAPQPEPQQVQSPAVFDYRPPTNLSPFPEVVKQMDIARPFACEEHVDPVVDLDSDIDMLEADYFSYGDPMDIDDPEELSKERADVWQVDDPMESQESNVSDVDDPMGDDDPSEYRQFPEPAQWGVAQPMQFSAAQAEHPNDIEMTDASQPTGKGLSSLQIGAAVAQQALKSSIEAQSPAWSQAPAPVQAPAPAPAPFWAPAQAPFQAPAPVPPQVAPQVPAQAPAAAPPVGITIQFLEEPDRQALIQSHTQPASTTAAAPTTATTTAGPSSGPGTMYDNGPGHLGLLGRSAAAPWPYGTLSPTDPKSYTQASPSLGPKTTSMPTPGGKRREPIHSKAPTTAQAQAPSSVLSSYVLPQASQPGQASSSVPPQASLYSQAPGPSPGGGFDSSFDEDAEIAAYAEEHQVDEETARVAVQKQRQGNNLFSTGSVDASRRSHSVSLSGDTDGSRPIAMTAPKLVMAAYRLNSKTPRNLVWGEGREFDSKIPRNPIWVKGESVWFQDPEEPHPGVKGENRSRRSRGIPYGVKGRATVSGCDSLTLRERYILFGGWYVLRLPSGPRPGGSEDTTTVLRLLPLFICIGLVAALVELSFERTRERFPGLVLAGPKVLIPIDNFLRGSLFSRCPHEEDKGSPGFGHADQ